MNEKETSEQRRERLTALAKERVARLIEGKDVVPHLDTEGRRLTDREANELKATLLTSGQVEFRVGAHTVRVSEVVEEATSVRRFFIVYVDDLVLEGLLSSEYMESPTQFVFATLDALIAASGSDFFKGVGPYEALLPLIGKQAEAFSTYLDSLRARRAKQLAEQVAARDEVVGRISVEAERFRDVLTLKYRQLVYKDEYDTLETSRFVSELRRFAEKRLPEVSEDVVVETVFGLVSTWAEDEQNAAEVDGFDASMSPTEYEHFCAQRFAAAGWTTRMTKGSGDQGVDIVCEANGVRLVVQCKLYSSPVGNAAVQEVIAAREFEYADRAAVVSNAPFTRAAKELASVAKVILLHHDAINTLMP